MTGLTLGTLIGFPLLCLLVVALTACSVWARPRWRAELAKKSPYSDSVEWGLLTVLSGLLALILAIGTAVGMYPYDLDYHSIKTVTGTVEATNSRLISSGKSVEQRIVIRLAGKGDFGCDDTRCTLLVPGDVVRLGCTKEFHYASDSGWACRYQGVTK